MCEGGGGGFILNTGFFRFSLHIGFYYYAFEFTG